MKRIWHMLMLLLKRDGFQRAQYIKRHNLFKKIGVDCYYHPFHIPTESWLVSLGDNVVIATGVELITHDMSYALLSKDKILNEVIGPGKYPYYTGKITIGNNVMIGANVLILPDVTIGNQVVIGAGSIVAKDIPSGVVVAGCPAKIIGSYYSFAKKRKY